MNQKEKDWWLNIAIAGVMVVIFGIYLWFETNIRYTFSKKSHKSKLARAYHVRNETLNKWIKLLGKPEIKEKYKGSLAKKVIVRYYTESFGKPSDRPKYKGSYIVSKEDIWISTDYGDSTVYKKIMALENPEKVIGMSLDTYGKLEKFPPKHVKLILKFLNKKEEPTALPEANPPFLGETSTYSDFDQIS